MFATWGSLILGGSMRFCFLPLLRKNAENRNEYTNQTIDGCVTMLCVCWECKETELVRFKRGFKEGLLKDNFAFFEAIFSYIKVLYLRGENPACKMPIYASRKGVCQTPFKWTGSIFPRMRLFGLSWKLPTYNWVSCLQLCRAAFLFTTLAFYLQYLALLLAVEAFLLTVGKCA